MAFVRRLQRVNTPLIMCQALFNMAALHIDTRGADDVPGAFASLNALPNLQRIESNEVSDAVVWCHRITSSSSPASRSLLGADNTAKKGNCSI